MATGLLAPPGLAPLSLGASWPGEGRSWHWAHGWGSPSASPPDHLLADAYSGHEESPEMQPAPQIKRRLSLVSNGRYEGSLSEEVVAGKPAGEGPQPRLRRKKLERMYSVDRVSGEGLGAGAGAGELGRSAGARVFRGYAERKRRKRENDSASVIQRVFRGYAERKRRKRENDSASVIQRPSGGDLQSSHCTLGEAFEDLDWEAEKGLEAVACDAEGFLPPKVMLISSKVPRAEYIPTIIRRDDPSIIPILYDHEHATFEDILEEIEKKLNIYHKGAKIWKMLIFCQGGPGHLYLLKNKVATFAKVEKEEDMTSFWKRLSRLMSKVNPEPNVIHIMGCYILGNPNGEKLFQNLRTLMTPYRVIFESPLELSAQGELVRLLPRTGMGCRGSAPFPQARPS
ncbi:PREDICTED: NMDA receptor synaptonuclear signaling and neuronal migration factor, partial [Myotis brandtii]|uniref:NMDA receptor synaptonuclear signaling and neuronal migration factor n=1 Tax=Myotis brandtii TaxID=109478 RepID=UPI000703D544